MSNSVKPFVAAGGRRRFIRRAARLILFATAPAFALLLATEGVFRLAHLGQPALRSAPLPEEMAGVLQADRFLLWSLRPGIDTYFGSMHLTVNRLGLRGSEVLEKGADEFRILSLGESSTFGATVSDEETYSARLQEYLNAALPSRHFTVINAGVSAYSSVQSLKYLELRGGKLKPDLVLFYHEVNDYLPSSVRDSQNNEIGLTLTDQQLLGSKAQRVNRFLLEYSALFRFLSFQAASRRIQQFNRASFDNPLLNIGLPNIGLPPFVVAQKTNDTRFSGLNEKSLGRRVSDAERAENLKRLQAFCRLRGMRLIVIHPAYRHSAPHECLLTRFCRENRVLMFEAFPSLHPPGVPAEFSYRDLFHPTPAGHDRLARDLAAFIATQLFTNAPDRRPAK